jgi:hypothetical protein
LGRWIQDPGFGLNSDSVGSVDPDSDWDPDPGSYKKKEKIPFQVQLRLIWIQNGTQLIWIRNSDKSGTGTVLIWTIVFKMFVTVG